MHKRTFILLLFAIAASLLCAKYLPSAPHPHKANGTYPTDQDMAIFQRKADLACQCVRQIGQKGSKSCWEDYRSTVAPFQPNGLATTCTNESATEWDYFPPFDDHGLSNRVVTIQRAYGACSASEESELIAHSKPRKDAACG